jgi:hypothetical protein
VAFSRSFKFGLVALSVVAAGLFALLVFCPRPAAADEGWVIRSFDAQYSVDKTGVVHATESISVDFGALQRHGIFRDVPVQYPFDPQHLRVITLSSISVDDGSKPIPFETSSLGTNERIKIGDPNKLVSGQQHYRISYTVAGALNPFVDHDELYWNVTGNQWPVTIEHASAAVTVPSSGVQKVRCFQGPTGSANPCGATLGDTTASFTGTSPIGPQSGLTFVVALQQGLVTVAPPVLVPVQNNGTREKVADFLGLGPLNVSLSVLLMLAVLAWLARQWWLTGRDHWFGDRYYLTDGPNEERKPLFSHETVVVEYAPPEIGGKKRPLRPAEIGLLLDEHADTLDVSATIVDLAVRGYLHIDELPKEGLLGAKDYELTKLKKVDNELLDYEQKLLHALFGEASKVSLNDMPSGSYLDFLGAKIALHDQLVQDKFFARDPDDVRNSYRLWGIGIAVAGAVIVFILGGLVGAGLLAVPIIIGGLALAVLAPAMPRRTAAGRSMYRRCLGFREYIVTAEKDREKFAEQINRFDDYLPYAMVFRCVKKWAAAFEGVDRERKVAWYGGPAGFVPLAFAFGIRDFSSCVSGAMGAAPGGLGASGFSPGSLGVSGFGGLGGFGGGAGGGMGGGGGGSW